MDTEGAFQVETVTLLGGCLIGGEETLEINTDCLGAMAAERGKNKEFRRLLGGYIRGAGVKICKVKAHPERRAGPWTPDDHGIYMADQVAGKRPAGAPSLRATTIIRKIARMGKIMLCGEDGEPFIGNLRRRCSREKLRRYWKKRDWYRGKRGKRPIWDGTRMDFSHKMMGKSKSMEDRTAVQRMAGGKSWCNNWANGEPCQACETGSRSEAHALRSCTSAEIKSERRAWHDGVSKKIAKVKDRDLKGLLEEMWTRMKYSPGGEMAMMGSFQPRWVGTMHKGRMELKEGEQRTVMNILKVIGQGARNLVRMYRNHVGKDIGSKELRQTNIRGYYGDRKRKLEVKESLVRGEKKKRRKVWGDNEQKSVVPKVSYNMELEDDIMYWEFKKG